MLRARPLDLHCPLEGAKLVLASASTAPGLGQSARLEASPPTSVDLPAVLETGPKHLPSPPGSWGGDQPSACLRLWINHKPFIFHPQNHKNNP